MKRVRAIAYVDKANKEWLESQPNGSSATINDLITEARTPLFKDSSLKTMHSKLMKLVDRYGWGAYTGVVKVAERGLNGK